MGLRPCNSLHHSRDIPNMLACSAAIVERRHDAVRPVVAWNFYDRCLGEQHFHLGRACRFRCHFMNQIVDTLVRIELGIGVIRWGSSEPSEQEALRA